MSKQDRAAKAAGSSDADSSVDDTATELASDAMEADSSVDLVKDGPDLEDGVDLDGADLDGDELDGDELDGDELRPAGKRAARGRRKAGEVKENVSEEPSRFNIFARLWRFMKQVIDELRKVIWPTFPETIKYTIIVLIFVIVLTAFISGVDLGFGKLVLKFLG